ncbi:MAG: hypothetical protein ACMUEM_04415 [Flavobacteriales bacterium AspAUS03]
MFTQRVKSMPFSIFAYVGFVALFGLAILNGIILVSHLNNLKIKL